MFRNEALATINDYETLYGTVQATVKRYFLSVKHAIRFINLKTEAVMRSARLFFITTHNLPPPHKDHRNAKDLPILAIIWLSITHVRP